MRFRASSTAQNPELRANVHLSQPDESADGRYNQTAPNEEARICPAVEWNQLRLNNETEHSRTGGLWLYALFGSSKQRAVWLGIRAFSSR
jgi:hypothetical protein